MLEKRSHCEHCTQVYKLAASRWQLVLCWESLGFDTRLLKRFVAIERRGNSWSKSPAQYQVIEDKTMTVWKNRQEVNVNMAALNWILYTKCPRRFGRC